MIARQESSETFKQPICDINSTLLHTHPEFTRIVFHGLRHSSATYQLIIFGGDAKTVQRPCKWRIKGKSHEESCDSSWDFGALEGTRIPGPLIKSQMLYQLSYERIFCNNTILPNNITINADKMQVPGRKFLRCTYEVPRGDFKRPNGLAASEMEGFYPDKFLFTKPDRIVTIKANPI